MGTEVTTPKSFQERVFDEIKSKIGDLMTPEEIKKLVDQAMQQAFFTKTSRYDHGQNKTIDDYPELVRLIKTLTEKQVSEAVKLYLAENAEIFKKVLEAELAKGIIGIVQGYIHGMMSSELNLFASNLANRMQRGY